MIKLSAAKIKEIVEQIPTILRVLSEEKEKLASEVAQLKREQLAGEIVRLMDEQNLTDKHLDFKQKVATVLESDKDLNVLHSALTMKTFNMSIGSISPTNESNGNLSSLESYLFSEM